MITEESFTPDWIMSHRDRKGYERINPPLVEKMIHALTLVEQLSITGLDFVFKGATSLILLMETPRRFSIDITEAGRDEIESALDKIVENLLSHRINLTNNAVTKKEFRKLTIPCFIHQA